MIKLVIMFFKIHKKFPAMFPQWLYSVPAIEVWNEYVYNIVVMYHIINTMFALLYQIAGMSRHINVYCRRVALSSGAPFIKSQLG